MRTLSVASLMLCATLLSGQSDSTAPLPGNKAPSFILRDGHNIKSITMPYMKKLVLLNFWSSTDIVAQLYNDWLRKIAKKYRYSSYRNAEGFEIIAVAVQSDREGWLKAIKNDSLGGFTHAIAAKGFAEEVCVRYNISKVPSRVLIDENGIILSIDPSMMQLETMLDERKNFKSVTGNISGVLAQSSDREDPLKYSRVFLFSVYGDSLGKTGTSEKGNFSFTDLNMSREYVLKVDNKIDINTSDPIALYTRNGEFITDGRTRGGGFVFNLNPRVNNRLIVRDENTAAPENLEEIDVVKSLVFSDDGSELTAADINDLSPFVKRLTNNPALKLDIVTHADTRLENSAALDLTSKQASALKSFFQSKGISATRIKAVAKGNAEPRKYCDGGIDCREKDYLLNRRTELSVYKD